MSDPQTLTELARKLRAASAFHPLSPIHDTIGGLADAYAVQATNRREWLTEGRVMSGYKVAYTTAEAQRLFATTEPVYGTLFDDMRLDNGATISAGRLAKPMLEGEIVLELATDLPAEALPGAEVQAAVGAFYPALEIPDGRITGAMNAVDMAADNAGAAAYVLGQRQPLTPSVDLATLSMTMARNGEVVSSGTGAVSMGNPLNVLVWLQGALARDGIPMRAGQIVYCGSLVPIIPAQPGDVFEATFAGLGPVSCRFPPGNR